jgi:broad specificity phosphatase PhoE
VKLLLIRHAESLANAGGELSTVIPGPALTEAGHRQAEEFARSITSTRIDGLVVSSMTRSRQTAEPLAELRSMPITELSGLHEIEAGDFEGSTDRDSLRKYSAAVLAWGLGERSVSIPGAFDGHHFFDRFDGGIAQVVADHAPDDTIAVFSHSIAMRVWVAVRSDIANPQQTATEPLDNLGVVILTGPVDRRWHLAAWQGTSLATKS